MKRALVFSGGGAKGSYELGVWRALRHLHKKIDIVTGTSIGSINGALFAQKEYSKAYSFWMNTRTEDLISYNKKEKIFSESNKKFLKDVIKNKGLPNNMGEEVLRKYVDEDKIRRSNIELGIVTVNIKTMTPKELTKKDIPNGKLIDYVVASCSAFPAITTKKLDDGSYIDGGYYDNVPIDLAIKMGATEVIAVDLGAIGRKVKKYPSDIKIDIIRNRAGRELFTLDFSLEKAKERMRLGYNDTMKYYGKLEGDNFTFRRNNLIKNYKRVGNYYEDVIKEILLTSKNKVLKEVLNIGKYKKLLLDLSSNKKIESTMNDSIEYLGEIFEIENDKIYDINTFNRILLRKTKELDYIKVSKNLKGKMLVGYIYNKYLNENDKDKIYKELFNISLIFKKDFLAACYLVALTKKYPVEIGLNEFHDEIYKLLRGE